MEDFHKELTKEQLEEIIRSCKWQIADMKKKGQISAGDTEFWLEKAQAELDRRGN